MPSPKVIVLFFKFIDESTPCTFVIGPFLALCKKLSKKKKGLRLAFILLYGHWKPFVLLWYENDVFSSTQLGEKGRVCLRPVSPSQAPPRETEPNWGDKAHQRNLVRAKKGGERGKYQPFSNSGCVYALSCQSRRPPLSHLLMHFAFASFSLLPCCFLLDTEWH